jgi:hypothetical protein
VSGTASSDAETGVLTLDVEVPDGDVVYQSDGETVTVAGTFEGDRL